LTLHRCRLHSPTDSGKGRLVMAKPDSSTRVKVDDHEVVTCGYGLANSKALFRLTDFQAKVRG
jgi:hypothetical protein